MKTKLKISGLAFLFAVGVVGYAQNARTSTPEPLRPSSPDQFHHETSPVSSRPLTRQKNLPLVNTVLPFSLEESSLESEKKSPDPETPKPLAKPKAKSPTPSAASVSPPPSESGSALTPNSKKKKRRKKQTQISGQIFDTTHHDIHYSGIQDGDPSPSRTPDSNQYFEEEDEFGGVSLSRDTLSHVYQQEKKQRKQEKRKAWKDGIESRTPPPSAATRNSPPPLISPSQVASPAKEHGKYRKNKGSTENSVPTPKSTASSPKKDLSPSASPVEYPEKKIPTPPPPRTDFDPEDASGIARFEEDSSYGPLPQKDPE